MRTLTIALLLLAGVIAAAAAAAAPVPAQTYQTGSNPGLSSHKEQAYPTKYVRIITGTAGSVVDIVARHLGQRLSERWGQSVVVENRGGAGLTIGTSIAAQATPDGYSVLLADRTSLAVAPSLHKNLPYDPVKDFAPITLVSKAPFLLVAHPSVPAANLREFIAYAKQNPGLVNYAGAGPGTGAHMTGELLKHVAGINLLNVQYKGGGAVIMAIISGEAKAGFSPVPVALPHVRSSKVKVYAITSTKRFAGAPDIPTATEAGLPGFESEQWNGMLAPARTPAALVARLNRDIVEILQTPAMQTALLAQGAEPAPGMPAEFAAFIKSETVKLKKVIELAGIRAE